MTLRTPSLNDNPISSDLPSSGNVLKNNPQSEVKFRDVLAKTQESAYKDSGNKPLSNSGSENEKNHQVKGDNQISQKQETVSPKQASNAPVNVSRDKQSKIVEEEKLEQSPDIKSEEVIEDVQNQKLEDDSELLSAISVPQHNNGKPARSDDLIIDENLNVRSNNSINLDEENTDSSIAKGRVESTIISNGNTISDTVGMDETIDSQTAAPDTGLAIISGMPNISKDLKSKNLLQSEILSGMDDRSEVLVADDEVQAETLTDNEDVNKENIIATEIAITPANMQALPVDISTNESTYDSASKLLNIKGFESAKTQEMPDATFTETGAEENVSVFSGVQNLQGQSKVTKGSIVLEETQNMSGPVNIDELTAAGQEIFDRGGSNDFDNLFSKMDSFVTVNDGKVAVDFKEIANLPDENVPHRADQITMAVRSAVGRGQSEISLRMYPEDLGAVDVKVEFSEVGKVQSIKFFATKETTLELLQKDYSILERSLKEVINAEDASLSFNLKDGRGEGSEYQPQEDFGLNNFTEDSERIGTINYQANLQIQQDDQVDIRV